MCRQISTLICYIDWTISVWHYPRRYTAQQHLLNSRPPSSSYNYQINFFIMCKFDNRLCGWLPVEIIFVRELPSWSVPHALAHSPRKSRLAILFVSTESDSKILYLDPEWFIFSRCAFMGRYVREHIAQRKKSWHYNLF